MTIEERAERSKASNLGSRQKLAKVRDAAWDLVARTDFWDAVREANIALPGEYDTLFDRLEDLD